MTPARTSVTPCRTAALALLVAGVVAGIGGFASAAEPAAANARPAPVARWWLGFADNPGAPQMLAIHLDSRRSVDVRVRAPALSIDMRVRVEPGTTTVIDVPASAMTIAGPPAANGILVTLDGPPTGDDADLSVRGLNHRPHSSDAFLALPESALGTIHRLLGYPGLRGAATSQALIVATRDDTTVRIAETPTCPAADARLKTGETWLHTCPDVSGARLEASAPVAVFAGAACAEVPMDAEFCSHLVEQLPPTAQWGRQFVAVPSAGRSSDRLRLLADQDGTEVRLAGQPVATLAAGAFHETVLAAPALIEASGPLLVTQYAAGSGVDGKDGDPFMVVVPATADYATEHRFGLPALPMDASDDAAGPAFAIHRLTLFAPKDAVGQVRLDGQPVPASAFVAIGDGRWHAAQLPISPGAHRVESPLPVGSVVHGHGINDSYGLPGAWKSPVTVSP